MECLALLPLKFSITSSDDGLLRTNMFVNAHPRTSVARLLQYVHWQVSVQLKECGRQGELGHVSDYCLQHAGRDLVWETPLQDIEPEAKGFIKVQLERRRCPGELGSAGAAATDGVGCDEDLTAAFTTTELQINVNALSVEKMMCKVERVSMEVTIGRLEKMALQILTDYECHHSSRNLCGLKADHGVEDFTMLFVKGKQRPICLDDEDGLYRDMTLSQLLGIDFTPFSSGFFSVMFKVRHGQVTGVGDTQEHVTIEFVSDATLAINQMAVTPETTVEQVKEFVCSVYTHTLRLSPADVRLIYKGQLIHRLDLAGKPCRIMEYIKEPAGSVKLHVYINQEYTETGPGFWNELFHSPDRFDFMNTRRTAFTAAPVRARAPAAAAVAVTADATAAAASAAATADLADAAPAPVPTLARAQSAPMVVPSLQQFAATRPADPGAERQFVTNAGLALETTQDTFTRCILHGQQVLVPTNNLEPFDVKLQIVGHTLSVSSQDFVVASGTVALAPHLIAKVELALGVRLENSNNVSPAQAATPEQASTPADAPPQDRLERWSRLFSALLLAAKTLYLIANYSVIPFFFVLELSTVLPTRYTAAIGVLILLRTIWSTRELWDMWITFFDLNSIDPTTYRQVKQHILDRKLTRLFYRDCNTHPMVIDIFMASNLRGERQRLVSQYTFEELNEQHGLQAWHHFLEGVGHGSIRKGPLDDFLISCLDVYEDSRAVMPQAYSEPWKQLLKLGQNDMERVTPLHQLPRHRHTWRALQRQVERIRQSQLTMLVLEHVVPDPSQDNLAVAVAKNLALFVLVLLPPLKHRVDNILEERKRSREQLQEQQHQEAPNQEEHPQEEPNQAPEELLPDRPGASGAAQHNSDD